MSTCLTIRLKDCPNCGLCKGIPLVYDSYHGLCVETRQKFENGEIILRHPSRALNSQPSDGNRLCGWCGYEWSSENTTY